MSIATVYADKIALATASVPIPWEGPNLSCSLTLDGNMQLKAGNTSYLVTSDAAIELSNWIIATFK